MKKKIVTLLLSLTLVSGVMGCGSAEATNADAPQTQVQEQVQQTQEQEQEEKTQQVETQQEQTTVQEEFEEIGGLIPKNGREKENLQKFLDNDNYYTYEEYWTKVNEIIEEKEKAAQEYGYTVKPTQVFENKEEFEKIGTYAPQLTKENCDPDKGHSITDIAEILLTLEEYYIEVKNISTEYIEWELWGKMKE